MLEEEIQTRFGHGKVNQDDHVSCDLALGSFALRMSECPTHDAATRVSLIETTGGRRRCVLYPELNRRIGIGE
jgi:hypothetical protein